MTRYFYLALLLVGCNPDYNVARRHQPPRVEILLPDPAYPISAGSDIVVMGRVELLSSEVGHFWWRLYETANPENVIPIADGEFSDAAVLETKFSETAIEGSWTLEFRVEEEEGEPQVTTRQLLVLSDAEPTLEVLSPCDGCEYSRTEPLYLLAIVDDDQSSFRSIEVTVTDGDGESIELLPDSLGQIFYLFEGLYSGQELSFTVEATDGAGNTTTKEVAVYGTDEEEGAE